MKKDGRILATFSRLPSVLSLYPFECSFVDIIDAISGPGGYTLIVISHIKRMKRKEKKMDTNPIR